MDDFTLKLDLENIKISGTSSKKDFFGPDIPNILSIIGLVSKGCANTYKHLCSHKNNIITEIQIKWCKELNKEIPTYTIGMALHDIRKSPVSAYTKYIQFKMLHSCIVTNKELFEMGLATDSSCPYCNAPI